MSMNQGQGQGSSTDDDLIRTIIVTIVLLVVAGYLISAQESRLNAISGAVAWVHIAPFAWLSRAVPALQDIPFLGGWLFKPADLVEAFLAKGGYALMEANEAGVHRRSLVLAASGRVALLIYGPILIYAALRGGSFRVDQKFRTRHSLESMIQTQTEVWMTARIARYIDPLKEGEISSDTIIRRVGDANDKSKRLPGKLLSRMNIHLSPTTWNRSMRPEEWLLLNGLSYDRDEHHALMSGVAAVPPIACEMRHRWEHIEMESIAEVLSAQLRTPWTGVKSLRPSHRAIFAVMALFYGYDISGGNRLLEDLAIVSSDIGVKRGKMDAALRSEPDMMKRIDGIALGDHGKKLASLAACHAWVESAFPTFLHHARKDRGVLPSAAFLWLKAEDRLMWYILNNVGNEAIMVEAAGAMAHSRAEAQIGRPMVRPAVYQAARAILEDYMDVTPARLEALRYKHERARKAGEKLDLIEADIFRSPDRPKDRDGLDEDVA